MARLKTCACMRRTLDREAHAASRLDVLSAWAISLRKRRLPLFVEGGNVLKTCNELPYKVYNSVPVVLYLNHSVRPGVPTVTKP
jgi:hypothetical protein